MKNYKVFITGVVSTFLLFALIGSAFLVGNVYASTGCFTDTNGNWAETYICWLKDNGISNGYVDGTYRPNNYITRAEIAVFLQRIAEIPPSKGLITISEGFGNWRPFRTSDDLTFENYTGATYLYKASTGLNYITLQPSIPTVLYGKNLQLLGVEFCYNTTGTVYLDYLEIDVPTHVTGPGVQNMQYSDDTNRTGSACRYYVLPSPVTLTDENTINLFVLLSWPDAGNIFQLGRTTFVLQPTGTSAVGPSSLAEDVVILSESSGNNHLPSTSAP